MSIASIRIQNFKSIRDSGEVPLTPVYVLIGANGAGKSNFIQFFKLLHIIYNRELQLYVARNGRADNFLHFGRKVSKFISGQLIFDNDFRNEYAFTLVPDQAGNLIFSEEWSNNSRNMVSLVSAGATESKLKGDGHQWKYLSGSMKSLRVFHFHDTSATATMKQPANTQDYAYLHEDGGNIAAFLYRLQETEPQVFALIERVIQSIAPFFDRFYLQPDEINPQQIFLRWREKGYDSLFTAHNLSDGTLRMVCLATLLLQPGPPATIIIDEPELGLHPFAISKIAGLLLSVPETTQVIISTQSVNVVNEFSADDVIVVQREDNNETTFTRQSEETLKAWLEEYALGELWEKNVLGGRPR